MSTTSNRLNRYSNQRRSNRVMLAVRIQVTGNRPDGKPFSEEALTAVVNAHGALIHMAEPVTSGQELTIRHLKSGEELGCRVVEVGTATAGKAEVGIEFHEPAPRFWRISFPPEDWTPRSPEAKPVTAARPPTSKPPITSKPKLAK